VYFGQTQSSICRLAAYPLFPSYFGAFNSFESFRTSASASALVPYVSYHRTPVYRSTLKAHLNASYCFIRNLTALALLTAHSLSSSPPKPPGANPRRHRLIPAAHARQRTVSMPSQPKVSTPYDQIDSYPLCLDTSFAPSYVDYEDGPLAWIIHRAFPLEDVVEIKSHCFLILQPGTTSPDASSLISPELKLIRDSYEKTCSIMESLQTVSGFVHILGLWNHAHAAQLSKWLDKSPPGHHLRRPAIYLIARLSVASGALPASLFVHGVDIGPVRDPVQTGGFADIYRGKYQGKFVAVKRPRIFEANRAIVHQVISLYLLDLLLARAHDICRCSAERPLYGGNCDIPTFFH
jgi:hypothetical protein